MAASYLAEQLNQIPYMNLHSIANATGVSEATIIRLCKRMGYKGFRELRIDSCNLESHSNHSYAVPSEETRSASISELMHAVMTRNIATMRSTFALVTDQYDAAAEALCKANVITMIGNGDAIVPCQLISMKFLKIGKPCVLFNDQDLQVFGASAIRPEDVLVAVSHTGRSSSIVEATRIAQERGATTIGITGAAKSPLMRYCSIVLHAATVDSSETGDIVARRIAEQTILETLYLNVLNNSDPTTRYSKKMGAEKIKIYKISDSEVYPNPTNKQ